MGRRCGEAVQGIRLVKLLRILETGKKPRVTTILDVFSVDIRTFNRDLKALRAADEKVIRQGGRVWLEKPIVEGAAT